MIIGFGDFQISGLSLLGDVLAFVAAGVISGYYFLGQNIREEVSALTYSVLAYITSAAGRKWDSRSTRSSTMENRGCKHTMTVELAMEV